MNCIIWGTPCRDVGSNDEFWFVDSPRVGGKYKVFGSAQPRLGQLSYKKKALLTSWLLTQRRAGIIHPEITGSVMEEVETLTPMPFTGRVHAALEYMGTQLGINELLIVQHPPTPEVYMLLALTECADVGEAQILLKMMCEMGLLRQTQETAFSLSAPGWSKFEEIQTKAIKSAQAFVAMWFNESTEEPYRNGIYKAIYDSGYDPARIDTQHQHLNKVDDEIIAEIRRSRFLVADFTCEPGTVRGGVYFEAGFAMGLNIPIIWTCKDTSMNDLHFDTRQYPHIPWKDSADLYRQLKARIGAVIGDGPRPRK